MSAFGNIYVLANPAMPGLVKIGKSRPAALKRAYGLSKNTAVPADFYVIFSETVYDCDSVELFVKRELARFRYNTKREFFALEPTLAGKWVAALLVMARQRERSFLAGLSPLGRALYEARRSKGLPPIRSPLR